MLTPQHFDSQGIDIAYLDSGAGSAKTPVLLIHGFASNAQINWVGPSWFQTLQTAGYRVVAIDNRGHGHSAKLYNLEDYSAAIMAEDAKHLLDHVGIAKANVIGYSMGARIATFLALAHPDRVAKLVIGGLGYNMIRGMAGTGPIAHALEAESLQDVTNPTARTFRLFAEQTKSDLKALAACIRSSRAPLTAEMVAKISCPVLVAVGEQDVIAGSPDELARLIPGATAFTIPNRDHMKATGDKAFKDVVLNFFA